MNDLRKGDKVQVTYVGEVVYAGESDLEIKGADSRSFFFVADDTTARTIEVLERAEVPWIDGDVAYGVSLGEGVGESFILTRDSGEWYTSNGVKAYWNPDNPGARRTWKPLIRGGKRVVNK